MIDVLLENFTYEKYIGKTERTNPHHSLKYRPGVHMELTTGPS